MIQQHNYPKRMNIKEYKTHNIQTITKGELGIQRKKDLMHTHKITGDKWVQFIMIKESTHQENMIIIKICTSKQSPKVYEAKANKSKVKTDNSTVIVGDFGTPLLRMDRTLRISARKQKTWATQYAY